MARPKDCIFCHAPANSREHVFLADLGGRREHRGLLCHACNARFGRELDPSLATGFRLFNGLLGVRPDGGSQAHKARITSGSDGRELLLDHKGQPSHVKAELTKVEKTGPGREIREYEVSTEEQFREVLGRQKNPTVVSEKWVKQANFAPLSFQVKVGDNRQLRAVARQALNFLALHYPRLARSPELRNVKDFITGVPSVPMVWLEPNLGADPLPPSPFDYGHRIIIGLDEAEECAYVKLSIFDTLFFVVDFGHLPCDTTETLIHDINPLSDRIGDGLDWSYHKKNGVALCTPRPALKNYVFLTDQSAKFKDFLTRVENHRWNLEAESLILKLTEIRMLPEEGWQKELLTLLDGDECAQRIINLMRDAALALKHTLTQDLRGGAVIAPILNPLCQADDSEEDHISALARPVLIAIKQRISESLVAVLRTGAMTPKDLRSLIEGPRGRQIAKKCVDDYLGLR